MAAVIESVSEVGPELVDAMARLIPQLSSSAPPPSLKDLEAVVGTPGTTMLVATIDGRIVGTTTLVVFRIPTGARAWIEDVVVDKDAARQGIASGLTRRAIELAREAGATGVDLTSRPSREAANKLYLHLGFERRETNVYRFDLRG